MKVIVIEEAQDITSIKVNGLLGFLFTFEMSFDGKPEKMNKGIVLQSFDEEEHDDIDRESEESLANFNSLLSKQFNHVLKRFEKRLGNFSSKNNKFVLSQPSKQLKIQNAKKEADKFGSISLQKEKSFKCREFEGYGYFQVECPNFLKNENKSYVV